MKKTRHFHRSDSRPTYLQNSRWLLGCFEWGFRPRVRHKGGSTLSSAPCAPCPPCSAPPPRYQGRAAATSRPGSTLMSVPRIS
eukprot:1868038-Rhodomonas_salina.1